MTICQKNLIFKFVRTINSFTIDKKRKSKIKEVIDNLKKDPFFYPYKKLNGTEADYRLRVGSFRISYSINKAELLIEIIKIGKRENFYKK